MNDRAFKLNTPAMAVLVQDHSANVVTIPASAIVTIVDGDINNDGLVTVRYQHQNFTMFAKDLRRCGEPS